MFSISYYGDLASLKESRPTHLANPLILLRSTPLWCCTERRGGDPEQNPEGPELKLLIYIDQLIFHLLLICTSVVSLTYDQLIKSDVIH